MSLWDEGNYVGNLVEASFGKASTGTQQVVLTFDIDGNKKLVFLFLSDASQERTFEELEKLGWNGSTSNPQFDNVGGIELYMVHDDYGGKPREKWNLSSGGYKAAPIDASEGKRIEALWRSRGGKTTPAKPGTKPAPAKPPAGKAPTAPPSRAPAPTKTAAEFDKDAAWGYFEKAKLVAKDFFDAIEAVQSNTGKAEADFGDAEWKAVAAVTEIPF